MKELSVNLSHTSYRIVIEHGLLSHMADYIKEVYKNKKIFIVTETHVASLYLDKVVDALKNDFEVDYVIVPEGENSKSLSTFGQVCESLLMKDIRRSHMLLALGGGVIGDLTGFVASALFRGIPYIGVPTSLLAQMDSSIGGKTGIDFFGRKNILGAFKQPSMVLIDPDTLNTLSPADFTSGMGELIKHGCIGNRHLLTMLEDKPKITEEIIAESLKVKKAAVEEDEFDTGIRMTLNFGHTFGHAIELKYGYKHGVAVGIGMRMALEMGADLGITPKECIPYVTEILKGYDFPMVEYKYQDYLKDVFYDKKNIAGTINFIFLTELGKCTIYKMTEEELKEKYKL